MAPRSTDSCSLTAMDCNSAVVSARSEEEDDEDEEEEDEEDEDEEGSIVASLSKLGDSTSAGNPLACTWAKAAAA